MTRKFKFAILTIFDHLVKVIAFILIYLYCHYGWYFYQFWHKLLCIVIYWNIDTVINKFVIINKKSFSLIIVNYLILVLIMIYVFQLLIMSLSCHPFEKFKKWNGIILKRHLIAYHHIIAWKKWLFYQFSFLLQTFLISHLLWISSNVLSLLISPIFILSNTIFLIYSYEHYFINSDISFTYCIVGIYTMKSYSSI